MSPKQPKISLEVQNLHKTFGDKHIHQGVSFQVYQNEILGLLGGSGSGKSVLLRCIIGLEHPDQGDIIFHGKKITHVSEKMFMQIRIQIGYVFQNGALFDSLTVEENLAYPLQAHTQMSDAEILKKINTMLQQIDMTGSNHLYPNELSGGMQKRAGLARALILGPQLILFDEPTAGLDPINTKRLIDNIKTLQTTGITGIFVTHDIPTAFEIVDRIAILNQGKIYAIDTVENIRNSKDPFIQNCLQGHTI